LGFNAHVLVFLWPLFVDRPWFAAHLWEDKCSQESIVILMDKEKARGHTIHADKASFQRHGFESLNKLKMNIYCAMMLVLVHRVCLVSFRGLIENYSAEAG